MASPSGILTDFFNSPRRQRRFFILSAAVLAIGVGAFLAMVVFRGTPNAFTDTLSNKPAQLYHPDKKVPLSKEEVALARRFIKTAVERRDLNAAYTIVHPDLKGTLTRKEWDTGNIPVVSYLAENADTAAFSVDYSFKTSALLEIDLVAKPGKDQRPELRFYLGLKREGGKSNGRWLVNYWQPHWKPPVPQAVG
jgi:hypothetical protein